MSGWTRVALCLSLLLMAGSAVAATKPSRKARKKKPRVSCWALGVNVGTTTPLDRSPTWRLAGWESGVDIGYMLVCRGKVQPKWRFGLSLQGSAAQFYGAGRRFTRVEASFGPRLQARIARNLYLGGRLALAARFVKDGRFPSDVDPVSGENVSWYSTFGLNVGPELWWDILPWLVATVNLDYLLSFRLADNFPGHRGQPLHALNLRFGVMFLL